MKQKKMTISEICKCECEEAKEILNKYNLKDEEVKKIILVIQNAYYQYWKTSITNRIFEKKNKKISTEEFLKEVLEEQKKFPFECEEL